MTVTPLHRHDTPPQQPTPRPQLSPAIPAPPPVDLDAERSVLSCAMHSPHALTALADKLTPADFYDPTHRILHTVLTGMWHRGDHVDLVTVKGHLDDLGYLDHRGGDIPATYLVEVLEAAPFAGEYEVYITRLVTLSRVRQMLDEGARLMRGLRDPHAAAGDRDHLVSQTIQRLQTLLTPPDAAAYTGARLMDELNNLIDLSTGDVPAKWGLADLDRITRGFLPGRLILLGARPGVGKSSLAIQAAANVAKTARVLFWSYEMSAGEVAAHAVAATSHVPLTDILQGRAFGHPKAQAGFRALEELALTVRTDAPDITGLVAATVAEYARRPLGLVVVDYVQLVPASRTARARDRNREQEVAEVSKSLKQLARRLQVPVLACVQPNRQAVDRMPQLSDLRESGSLEMDADQVIFLRRPPEIGGKVDLHVEGEVAKNRMGVAPVGFLLAWLPEYTAFGNFAYDR